MAHRRSLPIGRGPAMSNRFIAWPNGSPWHESAPALSDSTVKKPLAIGSEIDVEAIADLFNEWESRIARLEADRELRDSIRRERRERE